MIKSMTGYGRGSAQFDDGTLTVELRSVNSRFAEVHSRLPREYASLETKTKTRIKEVIRRGRVDISLSLESPKTQVFSLNTELVRNYLQVCRQLQDEFGLSGDVTLNALLQLPGVIDVASNAVDIGGHSLQQALDSALDEAIASLQQFRLAEGRTLSEEISGRTKRVSELLQRIEKGSEDLMELYRRRFAARLHEILPAGSVHVDSDRVIMEAALYAEKSDIREEIVRLRSHIDQFAALLDEEKEVGKQLDFLLQEMNREANTILSKAGPAGVARDGVEMKAEIEKLREQVQNIE